MLLPDMWELPEEIKVRFGEKSPGKQRAMYHREHLLLVLHEVPQEGEEAGEAVFFWRQPDGAWQFSGRGAGLPSLRQHVDRFEQREDALHKKYKAADDAEDYFRLLDELAPVLRAVRNLHNTLQAAREAVPADRELIKQRDEAYEIERGFDLLYTDTKNALDYRMACKAEEQARLGQQAVVSSHRLNILAALFFPIMALGGMFGMNIPSGFEKAPLWLFWLAMLGGVVLGVVFCVWVLRRPGTSSS